MGWKDAHLAVLDLLHFLLFENIVVDLSSVRSSSLSLVGSTSPGEEDTKIGFRSDCPTSS